MELIVKVQPDDATVEQIARISGQLSTVIEGIRIMGIEADNLKREVQETKDIALAMKAKVDETLVFIGNLRAQLEAALAVGLTPAEVQALATSLDEAQQSLATDAANLGTATGAAPAPAPAPAPNEPPPAV